MLGRQRRRSRGTDTKISAPALATQPVPMTFTRGPQKRITSWIMSPDSTCPPGEEISMLIGLSLSSAKASRRLMLVFSCCTEPIPTT